MGMSQKMASQQTVLTSPQQEWELQGDDKTRSDKITQMTCWLQKYLQWLHCLSSTKDERIILMFLVSLMTSQNEDLVISCEWVLKVEIKTQCVIFVPSIKRMASHSRVFLGSQFGDPHCMERSSHAHGKELRLLFLCVCFCQLQKTG